MLKTVEMRLFVRCVLRSRCACILIMAAAFAASVFADPITWEGSTNLTMTANTTVDVPAGTTNVIDTLGGAYTLTKTGGGALEIRYSKSASAKVIVSEGLVRFANPRPDELFARAYFHVDASDLSSMTIETVNGTNFVTRWNDTDGRTARYATHCTTVWNCRKNPENRKPFLRMNFQNGLPVMDFGSLLTKYNTNEVGQALGYGAAMTFDRTTPYIKEGFNVFSDTPDYDEWPNVPSFKTAMSGMSIFSHETEYRFTRHDYSGATIDYSDKSVCLGLINDNSNNNSYFANGRSIWLDGSVLTDHPKWTRPSMGFHILRIHPTADGYTTFNNFAAEYSSSSDRSYGGQRIAEYVLFTNKTETGASAMTDDEAAMINRYLRVKWFPRTIASVTVANGASLEVDKSANLTIASFRDEGAVDLSLTCATNSCDRGLSGIGAFLHLDASATNTMTIVSEGGTNFVTRWNDVDGGSKYVNAETCTGSFGQRTEPAKRRPFLNLEKCPTGLPVVDLGSAIYVGYTNSEGVAIGYGGAFTLPSRTEGNACATREYLSVISDTEDLKTAPTGKEGPAYLAFYSGNTYNGQNVGRRGTTVSGKNPALLRKSDNTACVNGVIVVNGESKTYAYNPPDGLNVINLRPTSAVTCNVIGRSLRKNTAGQVADTYGGQRIAEYMVFTSVLADDKRQRIYGALRNKWFGDAPTTTNCYNRLSLGDAASMTVKYEAVSVTNKLALSGTLSAPIARAANIDVTGPNATISAPLTIPDGAALSFSRGADGSWTSLSVSSLAAEGSVSVSLSAESWRRIGGTSALLVAADTPISSIENWSIVGVPESAGASLALRDGCVWVDFADQGMFILVK